MALKNRLVYEKARLQYVGRSEISEGVDYHPLPLTLEELVEIIRGAEDGE